MRKIIGFHNPEEAYGFLSNWYLSDFQVEGRLFTSMEQYMMYSKARVFGDEVIMRKILGTSDVAKIKALGREVAHYEETVWNGLRQIIVYEGLLAKFEQSEELKEKLLATGDSVLAECAVQDCIWGIGLSMKDENRFDMKQWRGTNLLGFALMEVRRKLLG